MITCRVLGPVEVTARDAPVPPGLLWRKNLALIIYLARSPRRVRSRDHLMGLLWADKPEAAARHSLREAIRVLRHALGEEALVTEKDQVRLVGDALRLDTDEFESRETAGDWEAAASLVAGDFLEGFAVAESSAFEDWLNAERQTWRQRTVRALVCRADELLDRGQLRAAAEFALKALTLEPGAETATRTAMMALALLGDRAAALDCHERLVARLRAFGAEPGAETEALAARVTRERVWRLSGDVPVAAEQGAELRRAPLIGREDELQRLLAFLHRAAAERQPAVCVIAADPGLGKTRLVEEVLSRARLEGAAVTAVRAVEADLTAPWSGVVGLARGGLLDAPGLAAAAPASLAAFAGEIPAWADRFGAARAAPAGLGQALSEVLRAVGEEQPVVVAVDDVQWLDRESLLALMAIPRDASGVPIMLLLATQDQPSRPELDELRSRIGRDLAGTTLRLAPLHDAALRQLARWAVPSYDEPEIERLARRIASDSAGYPLLAVELLHAVALGLDLGTIRGAWPEPLKTLDQTLPSALPDAIVAAIRVGYRRLTKDAQVVLAASAVLGDRVELPALVRATGLADDQLWSALDELEWQRWLVAEPRGYSFLAGVTRDVIERDMVTAGQRRRFLGPG